MSGMEHMGALEDFERRAIAHMDAAYNLAFWLLRNRADAEDAVQDAYLRAFRAFDSFSGEDIRPWLLTIVRNVAYRWLTVRKRGSNVISLEEVLSGCDDADAPKWEPVSDEPTAEQSLLDRAEKYLVHAALDRLAPVFREVIVLRELEGLSYHEIAGITGTPIGTVMSRLARARDQLKNHLTYLLAAENKNAL
jgi:RNA polymerase sigma-70 factor, ECF subfamily